MLKVYKTEEQKSKLQLCGCLIIFFALFITTYMIRQEVISLFTMRTFLWGINYIGYAGMFLLFITQLATYKKAETIYWLLPIVASVFPLYTYILLGNSIGGLVMYISCCILPLYLLYVELTPKIREKILYILLLLLNIVMAVMFIWAVIDKVCGQPILKMLEPYITYDQTFQIFANPKHPDHKRFYSFFGHPLINTMWFNICYVLNVVWNKYHKVIVPTWLTCIVSFIAVACCGSKTGLFVVLGITAIAFGNNRKMYLPIGAVIAIIFMSGLMDNLLLRLSQSLTTGRVEALTKLLNDPNYPFYFFKGYGSNVTPYVTAAFEFTVVDMAFCFGIVYAVIMLGLPFVFVVMRCISAKAYQELLLWVLLFGEANTFYTCLHEQSDNPMIFYFLTMLLLNIIMDNSAKRT